ncbi:guanine nucleotide-binding protein g(o) subunit alpha [Anaeramoeba ignava]|uniref:Guanine nucleotide-binding protein g(O) subunit alpha n=1 Tax=Anaeramoeba ignava TaxID=1746090 RepID=A0A9Q0LKZ4_ANAIG|nr:guanine nucleotide-binding protein g(o) subunit alpha [Anaeramoeba ignava]
MGNKNLKKKRKEEIARNELVEQELKKSDLVQKQQVKLLILGAGDSGKSTLLKQMQILYKDGFSKEDKQLYRNVIRTNIITYIKILLKGVQMLDLKLHKSNEKIAEDFLNLPDIIDSFTPNSILASKQLWNDPAMKMSFEKRAQFQLADSAGYFLDNIDRIASENYKPSDQDILNCRISTTGVKVVEFLVNNQPWKVVDVGGQRSERKKWIHHFDDTTLLIYVVAVNEYDQKLFEDNTTNRLHESLKLFETTANNQFLSNKNCVILFNKTDLFKDKIQKVNFNKCFEDFKGSNNYEEVIKFIKTLFVKAGKNTKRSIFVHYSCATNTNEIRFVFDAVQSTILENILKEQGFM